MLVLITKHLRGHRPARSIETANGRVNNESLTFTTDPGPKSRSAAAVLTASPRRNATTHCSGRERDYEGSYGMKTLLLGNTAVR
jgi:hypothetical protein